MENKRIIFPNDNGGVAIVIPAPGVSIEEALKAVPAGKPHKVIDASDIPEDRTFRDAWTVDDAALIDGVGANYGAGSRNAVIGWKEDNTPVIQEVTQ